MMMLMSELKVLDLISVHLTRYLVRTSSLAMKGEYIPRRTYVRSFRFALLAQGHPLASLFRLHDYLLT